MRTAQLYINDEDHERLAMNSDPAKLNAALGRLITWGLGYPTVEITVADFKEPEIIATYYRYNPAEVLTATEYWKQYPEGGHDKPAFVLAAVWDKNTKSFGFHS